MNVTKKDAKEIKVVYSIVLINKSSEGKGVSKDQFRRHAIAVAHLQSRFGKEWQQVAKDWMDIEIMKKRDLEKEKAVLNEAGL
jgi:hypothetical protein